MEEVRIDRALDAFVRDPRSCAATPVWPELDAYASRMEGREFIPPYCPQ